MSSTIPYVAPSPRPTDRAAHDELLARYQAILADDEVRWVAQQRKVCRLGSGGQGEVFLTERQGADAFTLPVALKVFSPEKYLAAAAYDEDMQGIAAIAGRVALIQQDNLLDIYNFTAHDGIRMMEMEWIDGYDLRTLLHKRTLDLSRQQLPPLRWMYVNDVIITAGRRQPRFKPGVAIQVLRDCLAALAALHREGIIHGDLKPSNVMLKRTGNAKLIDIGSAADPRQAARRRFWSPAYAAPEIHEGAASTIQSDLASLGYILVEMLAGQYPFAGQDPRDLATAKRALEKRLPDMLPADVSCNELLLHLCRKLIAADPARRFPTADAADLDRKGAADFHRQLVKMDLASEYQSDIRGWLEELRID